MASIWNKRGVVPDASIRRYFPVNRADIGFPGSLFNGLLGNVHGDRGKNDEKEKKNDDAVFKKTPDKPILRLPIDTAAAVGCFCR